MFTYNIKPGSTDVSVTIRIIDSTDGTPETGVVFNTSGIDIQYRRTLAASTAITEATLAALTTAHADGGFLHIGNGYYRLDLPDAAVAAGAAECLVHGTVTGMVVIGCVIQLDGAAAVGSIYSDTTIATSKTTQIYSDTTHIDSDTARCESKAVQIYSDTTAIHTQTTAASSKAVQIYSDTTIVTSKTTQIYSDTTKIHSDTTVIEAAGASTSPDVLVATTIATLASQTSFTLTAGSADNDAYNNCAVIFVDVSTATQKAISFVLDYTGATKTVTLDQAPIFTIATTDNVYIMAAGAPLASDSKITRINSKATQIYSDTTIIYSDTTIATSKTTQIYSDTTAIHTQTTTINSKATQLYSDTTRIHSDTTQIQSDAVHIESDAIRIESKVVQIYSDTTAIHTQTTAAASKAIQIYSDTTAVHSDTTAVHSDTTAIHTQTTATVSDTTAIHSDTTAIQTKTDSLTYTVANVLDANVQRINDVVITGNGSPGTEFGV